MKQVLHTAASRGSADYGWLKTNYSFSFANYYNPERMGFGALRVINDDTIAGGGGFDLHRHNDMEIVTIMLDGTLKHRDSMGSEGTISPGDIQIMSAGTGVAHSEFNNSETESLSLLQIWIETGKPGIKPRYDQKTFDIQSWQGKLKTLVSPDGRDGSLIIMQNAFISCISLKEGKSAMYELQDKANGVYFFIIRGDGSIAGQELHNRDAFGVWEVTEPLELRAKTDCDILILEVPVTF